MSMCDATGCIAPLLRSDSILHVCPSCPPCFLLAAPSLIPPPVCPCPRVCLPQELKEQADKLRQQRDNLKSAVQMQQEMHDSLVQDTNPHTLQASICSTAC